MLHVYESPEHLKQSCESFWPKSIWKYSVCYMCVTSTQFMSQAYRGTVKPRWDLPGHHEEQTIKGIKLETVHCCYKILNVSLTDNYLKGLTGSPIITTTTTTKTTAKLQCVFPTLH